MTEMAPKTTRGRNVAIVGHDLETRIKAAGGRSYVLSIGEVIYKGVSGSGASRV